MANTSIQLKKSGATGNVPVSLAYGELALNYADGKLFYKHANGSIASIATGSVTNSFATINANSSLILASTPTDTLSIVPGNNITISTDAINKTITINSTGGSGSSIDQYARDTANGANGLAQGAFLNANSAFIRANNSLNANTGGTVAGQIVVDAGTYGNVTISEFASVYGQAYGPNPYSIVQVRSNDYVTGMGMQVYAGLNGLLYSNTGIQFNTSVNVRDKDFPTGGRNAGQFAANGAFIAQASLASTSNTTGSIQVVGGIGVKGNVAADGIIFADGTRQVTAATGGGGGTTYNQSLNTTDPVVFSSVGFVNNNSKVLGSNTSLSTTPNQIVDSFDISQYRTMKYVIQAVDESSVHSTEVLLVHDDNDAFITEYGTIQSSSNLMSISANVSSSNVNLIISPTNANTIIDFFRVSLQSARSIGFNVYGDLMTQTGTLDLMVGSGSWDENA